MFWCLILSQRLMNDQNIKAYVKHYFSLQDVLLKSSKAVQISFSYKKTRIFTAQKFIKHENLYLLHKWVNITTVAANLGKWSRTLPAATADAQKRFVLPVVLLCPSSNSCTGKWPYEPLPLILHSKPLIAYWNSSDDGLQGSTLQSNLK